MIKISAVIITYNEEWNIAYCIDSLSGVADEIVVVDSFSTDSTEQICKSKGVRFIQHTFEGHIEQKNYAMQQASNDYILSLDADERLSPELKKSIEGVKNNWQADAYYFNRLTNYCGKWIHHCGWYPDAKIRLWNRNKGNWGGVNPHDKVIMQGNSTQQFLPGDLLHYSFPTIESHYKTIESFSSIASKELFKKGVPSNFIRLYLKPVFTFVKKYFFQLGFLDGHYGFIICKLSGYDVFLRYKKLGQLYKSPVIKK
jgi:glycosyltransferase involved in cell wall biosynthesis